MAGQSPEYPPPSSFPPFEGVDNEAYPNHPFRVLTPMETEVATLAVMGMSNKAIAATFPVATYTVKFHLSNAYARLEVPNRVQMAVLFGYNSGRNYDVDLGQLTTAQQNVLDLIADGNTTGGVASEMGVGIQNVKFHLLNARRMLGYTSTVQLARAAVEHRKSRQTQAAIHTQSKAAETATNLAHPGMIRVYPEFFERLTRVKLRNDTETPNPLEDHRMREVSELVIREEARLFCEALQLQQAA